MQKAVRICGRLLHVRVVPFFGRRTVYMEHFYSPQFNCGLSFCIFSFLCLFIFVFFCLFNSFALFCILCFFSIFFSCLFGSFFAFSHHIFLAVFSIVLMRFLIIIPFFSCFFNSFCLFFRFFQYGKSQLLTTSIFSSFWCFMFSSIQL